MTENSTLLTQNKMVSFCCQHPKRTEDWLEISKRFIIFNSIPQSPKYFGNRHSHCMTTLRPPVNERKQTWSLTAFLFVHNSEYRGWFFPFVSMAVEHLLGLSFITPTPSRIRWRCSPNRYQSRPTLRRTTASRSYAERWRRFEVAGRTWMELTFSLLAMGAAAVLPRGPCNSGCRGHAAPPAAALRSVRSCRTEHRQRRPSSDDPAFHEPSG